MQIYFTQRKYNIITATGKTPDKSENKILKGIVNIMKNEYKYTVNGMNENNENSEVQGMDNKYSEYTCFSADSNVSKKI